MIRIAFAACIALASMSAMASAQEFNAEQRAACTGDYDKFCKGTMPGGGRVLACLSKNNASLSAACKKVVADSSKK